MLPVPHGGTLVSQIVDPEEAARFVAGADRPTVALNAEQAYDVVNIGTGVFSPRRGFLGRAEVEAVVQTGRPPDGLPWTIPILLDVDADAAPPPGGGGPLPLPGR